MAEFNAQVMTAIREQLTNRLYDFDWDTDLREGPERWTTEQLAGHDFLEGLSPTGYVLADPQVNAAKAAEPRREFQAIVMPTPRADWFEKMIVLPRSIELGLVLATKVVTIDVYNAYRLAQRSLQAFVNNAGAGIVITDLPALPLIIEEQDGRTFTLNVLTEGPVTIDGTLIWQFDTETITIPITGMRSVVFPFEPESPCGERLEFLTDVIQKRDGKEQRIALRDNPRQILEYTYLLTDARDRQRFQAILFDSMHRPLGVPVWFEPSILAANVAVDDLTITVDSTNFADYRANSLAILWESPHRHEVLEIESFTSTTITFKTAATKTFAKNITRVYPVRVGHARQGARGFKYPRVGQSTYVTFTVSDNDSSLGDVSPFPSFGGKVLLTEANAMDSGQLPEEYLRDLTVIDSDTGLFQVFSEVAVTRRAHAKRFFCRTRQRMWEVRRLLHALKGRQISFYIPTFFDDLTATQNVTSGSSAITVANAGYTDFIQSRKPWAVIRLLKKDGTSVIRTVVSSSELSEDEEQITVDSSWGVDATPAEIDLVQFLEKARLNDDEVEIEHIDALGQAMVTVPVISVLE